MNPALKGRKAEYAIRWSTDADGPEIEALLAQNGLQLVGADWSAIAGCWLCACSLDGPIIAAVQYCFGKPFARLDFMSFDPELSDPQKGRVMRELYLKARAVAKTNGASFAVGMIPHGRDYTNILVRRGCTVLNEGWLVVG